MALQEVKRLLERVGKPDSHTLESYRQDGGYSVWEEVVKSKRDPKDMVEVVKASGLRGRGGAGFSTGMKMSFMPPPSDKPHYMVCNGDESEPGTFKDRILLEDDPHRVLEGCILGAYCINGNKTFIYLRGEFYLGARRIQAAIDEAYEAGLLGDNVLGTGIEMHAVLHRGGGAYICGEETGLLESLEGKRAHPRIKPPFPAQKGAFACPTTVNNVETLANLPQILKHGADWYREYGTEKSAGTKLVCVSGCVKKPGTYEVPLGAKLWDIIHDLAGGPLEGREVRGVIPGGSSMLVLSKEVCQTLTYDMEAVQEAGSYVGSGGIIVLDNKVCPIRALQNLLHFYHHESCGQCTPCREGTGWIHKIVGRIEQGGGRMEDIELLEDVAGNMRGTTICFLSDSAAMPLQSFLSVFRQDFVDHIEQGKCPYGSEEHTRRVKSEELMALRS